MRLTHSSANFFGHRRFQSSADYLRPCPKQPSDHYRNSLYSHPCQHPREPSCPFHALRVQPRVSLSVRSRAAIAEGYRDLRPRAVISLSSKFVPRLGPEKGETSSRSIPRRAGVSRSAQGRSPSKTLHPFDQTASDACFSGRSSTAIGPFGVMSILAPTASAARPAIDVRDRPRRRRRAGRSP